MSAKSFRKLAGKVDREYRRKGRSAKAAKRIGDATAGKVAREKKAKLR